eukprot:gene10753-2841_t
MEKETSAMQWNTAAFQVVIQALKDGSALNNSSETDPYTRGRTDSVSSTSSQTLLVDSKPLETGPLFSGKPREAEECPSSTKHSYTPSRSRPLTSDAGNNSNSSFASSPTVMHRTRRKSEDGLFTDSQIEEEQDTLRRFLDNFTCYDIMPVSVKMVVLDTQLHVKKAFAALVQNHIRSAPLWDSRKQQFIGMLTVTDFINILLKYYVSSGSKMEELEEHRIQTWRDMSAEKRPDILVCMDPSLSVWDALKMLLGERIHRLPVIDSYTGNALCILTHKRILQFIYLNVIEKNQMNILRLKLADAQIGTYENLAFIHPHTTLSCTLKLFSKHRVSALPIVNEDGTVIDIYAKHDVINLARERTYNNLDVTVIDALRHRQNDFEGVQTCLLSHTMQQIVEQIFTANVHRLVVVDELGRLKGVLSLSDILSFLTRA